MRAAVLTLVACLLAPSVWVEDKEPATATKLVGTWEVVKGHLPAGTTVTFTKDNKFSLAGENEGKPFKREGTYQLKGDSLRITSKGDDGKESVVTVTIKSLTDKELVGENDKGEKTTLKRKTAGGKVGKHEAVIKGIVEQLSALADALESVKDKDTAKTAAAKINKACDRLSALGKEAKDLPKQTKEEDERLQKKYQADLIKAATRMQKAARPAGLASGGDPDFLKSIGRLAEVGKALQAFGDK